MSLRLRKLFPLIKGVRLNVSKTGVSVSVGKAGRMLNISPKGVKGTVGVPGSGVSYQQNLITFPQLFNPAGWVKWLWLLLVLALCVGLYLYS